MCDYNNSIVVGVAKYEKDNMTGSLHIQYLVSSFG